MTITNPLLVSQEQAAALLSVSPRTVFNMRKAGKIPYVRADVRILYSVDDLRDWIERMKRTEAVEGASPDRPRQQNGTDHPNR